MKLYVLMFNLLIGGSLLAQFQTNGSAIELTQDTCYRLTSAINTQNGSVWNVNQVNLSSDFEILVDMYLGANPGGADGMVFAFQQVSSSAGTSGGGIGIQGIQPSVFIQFDTWQNNNNADPFYDHASININGDVGHNSANNLAGPVQISATNTNVEDGQFHSCLIRWLVNSNGTQTLEMYYDCDLRLSHTQDYLGTVFNGNPNVFWGFTAATGGANNLHQFCFEYVSALSTNSGNQTICEGDAIQVSPSSFGASYNWMPAAGLSNPNIANPIASPDTTTTYTININNVCNVPIVDTLTVIVLDTNMVFQDVQLCQGSGITVGGNTYNATGNYVDTLTNVLGCDSVVHTNLLVSDTIEETTTDTICFGDVYNFNGQMLSTPGSYFDSLTTTQGCDSLLILDLTVLPLDTIDEDTVICFGDQFFAVGQIINAAGVYENTMLNSNGCDSTYRITVSVLDVTTRIDDFTICAGDSIFLESAWQFSAGTYLDTIKHPGSTCDSIHVTSNLLVLDTLYTFADTAICIGDEFLFDGTYIADTGVYTRVAVLPGFCPELIELTVSRLGSPTASIEGPETFCVEDGAELIGISSYPNILWLPVASNANPLIISETGTYILESLNNEGCYARDTLFVQAIDNCYEIQIPEAFSPNGDGVNDLFGPMNLPQSFYQMNIYNRLGELIFTSNDADEVWDGTYKGKDADIGIYSFYVRYKFREEHSEKESKGTLTLIR